MTSFALTLFPDVRAQTMRAASVTLEEMAWHARVTTAADKNSLPLWKLATFGAARTRDGALRSDANVISITGVEADYDGEVVGIDEATETAEKIGLRALIYTSPSHAPRRPRWRVMCPASRGMTPDKRPALMGRLNGAYRGIFSRESWTLSQTYFFGSVDGNPSHRVEIVEGQPIDLLDELDEIWLGPPAAPPGLGSVEAGEETREDAELVRCIVTAEHFHVELCALAARYVGRGIDPGTVTELLRGLLLSHPEPARDARWRDRYRSIPGLVRSAQSKYSGGVEARRAVARITHRLARYRRPAEEIRAAVLREAEQRALDPEVAIAIASAILSEKVEGNRNA
jgi:hypothetical protein